MWLLAPVLLALAAMAACAEDAQRAVAPPADAPTGTHSAPAQGTVPATRSAPPKEGAPAAGTTATAGAAPATQVGVTVTQEARQRIAGWGASVVSDTYIDPLVVPGALSGADLDRLDRLVFRTAGINLIRVFGPGYGSDYANARPLRPDDPRIAFMRRAGAYGVRFMLTGADAPLDLKAGQGLRPGAEGAYAGFLARVLRTARANGPGFAYTAIANEPDHAGALLEMSAEQSGRVYRALGRRIAAERLGARLVVGDNLGWETTREYASAELARPEVARAAVAVASHDYRGGAAEKRALAALAQRRGLPVWQTEWGTGCAECPDDRTMDTALRWSLQIAEGLVEAEVSAWFTFRAVADSTHGPGDALVVRRRDRPDRPFYTTKRFSVFRQYSSAGPPGARRLRTRGGRAQVRAVAFAARSGLATVLTNTAPASVRVRLDLGRGPGTLLVRRTSESEDFARGAPVAYPGRPVTVLLPGRSVTTLTHRPG